jgi:hypothetical protein
MLLHPSSVCCAVCREPLDILRAREARTCRKPACVHTYQLTPDSRKCRYCGDLVAITSVNPGRCEAERCRVAQSQETIRAGRALWEQLSTQARAARDEAVATRRRTGGDPALYPTAMVPRNRARVRKTAARRHKAFETLLRQLLHTMRNTTANDDLSTLEQPAPMALPLVRVVVATCSACRGHCCRGGRDHAFLKVKTVREYAAAHPDMDDEAIVHAYLSHLPSRAMHPGCVYQGGRGCTLPRDMRSAICNKYLCIGLHEAIGSGVSDATRGVYVAHRVGDQLVGGGLRALPILG